MKRRQEGWEDEVGSECRSSCAAVGSQSGHGAPAGVCASVWDIAVPAKPLVASKAWLGGC